MDEDENAMENFYYNGVDADADADEDAPVEPAKDENLLNVTLSNGKTIKAQRGCYVLQAYENCKWVNIAVFNPDVYGYEMAHNTMNWCNYPSLQIVIFT